ncbi:MAG: Unknown protein [uncultured Sulfurovum sp.]|uniref:DUF4291 domain-containing protein n=1 Tax=uncultured Sulfurovum sp. TaxID=269237 RepID=A0A6S6STH1_9BACT|nr:MAG: Unknown protein [uncultured Sulfurovum sp.]
MNKPIKEIRATYTDDTIRIYQAYSDAIADSALAHGKFISPPFKTERMTWIKPSFLWMMYRAGWGKKDDNQKRILAIDISREGFEWALEHSLMSNHTSEYTKEEWKKLKETTPVRIQWDPERDLFLEPLNYRAIQIGLSNEAVPLYVNEWIQNITEVTELASEIHSLIQDNNIEEAKLLLPKEIPYIPSEKIQEKIEISII